MFRNESARRLTRRIVALLLCISLSLAASSVVHASLPGTGRIQGHLLNGTQGKAPVAQQAVTLQMAQGPNSRDLATSTTDASGAFSFANLATDKTISYAIYVRYQGAQYVSDLISLADQSAQQVDLTVYDATTSAAKLAVVQATILVHEVDQQKSSMTISEVVDFKNLDTHSFVGSLDGSKGKPQALLFSLPQGARNITLSKGFDGYQVIRVDRGFATNAALVPGSSEFAFAFDVPYSTSTSDLSYRAIYPTVQLSLLVPLNIQASAAALAPQGETSVGQHQYRLFVGSGLVANQEILVHLEGLTVPTPGGISLPGGTSGFWLLVGLAIMLAILLGTAVIARLTQRQRSVGHARSVSRKVKRTGHIPHQPERASESKQALLKELLKLDKDFEAGKLAKAEYQERRAKAKARLRSLMSEAEAKK